MPFGDYEHIKAVGRGSYGEVSLVRSRVDAKKYVLKKMWIDQVSARDRRNAMQEASLLSKLRHPNIVKYRESFLNEDDSQLFIIMQYCDGGDLHSRLVARARTGRLLEERQVVDWFVQIALAVQFLHQSHVLHRDLKTQNIFLTRKNIVKVGDFGIARVLDSATDLATTQIGTPYYMSPELFSNTPYNHKSDIWSLGCCVYEMATLKQAFNARDMNSLAYKVMAGEVAPIPGFYSKELNDITLSMLHRQPDRRPGVQAMLRTPFVRNHIERFLGSGGLLPSEAAPATRPSQQPPATASAPSTVATADADAIRAEPTAWRNSHSSGSSPMMIPRQVSQPSPAAGDFFEQLCLSSSEESDPGEELCPARGDEESQRTRRTDDGEELEDYLVVLSQLNLEDEGVDHWLVPSDGEASMNASLNGSLSAVEEGLVEEDSPPASPLSIPGKHRRSRLMTLGRECLGPDFEQGLAILETQNGKDAEKSLIDLLGRERYDKHGSVLYHYRASEEGRRLNGRE